MLGSLWQDGQRAIAHSSVGQHLYRLWFKPAVDTQLAHRKLLTILITFLFYLQAISFIMTLMAT